MGIALAAVPTLLTRREHTMHRKTLVPLILLGCIFSTGHAVAAGVDSTMPGESTTADGRESAAGSRGVNGTLEATQEGLTLPNTGAASRVGKPTLGGETRGLTGKLPEGDDPAERSRNTRETLPVLPGNTPATPGAPPAKAGGQTPATSPTR